MNPSPSEPNTNIKGQRITIIGMARSGLAAAQLAKTLGAEVFVSDQQSSPELKTCLENLSQQNIAGEIGDHSGRIFEADLWVLSPGVPKEATVVQKALQNNIPVVGEIEFASWFTTAPILAVTGSNGKTTTVNILAKMCQTSEVKATLAGNVGIPFSQKVLEDYKSPEPKRVFVLEISSFQMEFIHHFRPQVALFLNISPDHLNRHPSMEDYVQAKLNMIRNQTGQDYIVYNADDPLLSEHFKSGTVNRVPFSLYSVAGAPFSLNATKIYTATHEPLVELKDILLPGRHNLSNLLGAATAAWVFGIPTQQIATIMRTFRGIPHRLEPAGTVNGVTFVNDSKATNVDAVKVALESYSQPIILILGGLDKGGDFEALLPHTKHKVKEVLAIGQAREKISTVFRDAVRSIAVTDLKKAVEIAHRHAVPGDIVLLSPGCASFDQFNNYEERGEVFKTLVNQLGATLEVS